MTTTGQKVRVWWEPTDDRDRSGFAGAFWPCQVVRIPHNKKVGVRYDNGDEEDVHVDHVSPIDTLPVAFGEEATELQPGEFCEVHNGSKTDPCAWLGRVVRRIAKTKAYMVEYPFHDSKPEKIDMKRIRRARIMESEEWRLIKPGQQWEDGDVTCPMELELINEDELEEYLENAERQAAALTGAASGKREPGKEVPASVVAAASQDGRKKGTKRSKSLNEVGGKEHVTQDEEVSDEKEDEGERGRATTRSRKASRVEPPVQRANVPKPSAPSPHLPVAEAALDPLPAAHPAITIPFASPPEVAPSVPSGGQLHMFVTIESAPSGGFWFVPVPVTQEPPPQAFKIHFSSSAVPQLAHSDLQQWQHPVGLAAHRGVGIKDNSGKKILGLKKPKSAWNCFVEKNRRAVADENPDKDNNEITQILGAMWRAVDPAEKMLCEADAEKDKLRYAEDCGAATGGQSASFQPKAPPPVHPVAARTAEQLYSGEFIKALQANPGGSGTVTEAVAWESAAAAWKSADPYIKDKYEANAEADRLRYENELATWQSQRPPPPLPPPPPAAGGDGAAASVVKNPDDWDEVLEKGIDFKRVKRRLTDQGYSNDAYLKLLDAWRLESPRIVDAMRCYKTYVHGLTRPNWGAFITDLFGAEQAQALKKPPKAAATATATATAGAPLLVQEQGV